ncbi:MAG: 6-phosphogluconolactonase [Candidatus Ozemobacteraceae bacterium]
MDSVIDKGSSDSVLGPVSPSPVHAAAGEPFIQACVEEFCRWVRLTLDQQALNRPVYVGKQARSDEKKESGRAKSGPGQGSLSGASPLYVALSGGATPEPLYRALGRAAAAGRFPVDAVRWFQTDERIVASDHADSNQRMISASLFGPESGLDPADFSPVPVDDPDLLHVAEVYENSLREVGGPVPCFDLILLGVGEDGHIASLFPGVESQIRPGANFQVIEAVKPATCRFTMTHAVLETARSVVIMATGSRKTEIVGSLLSGGVSPIYRRNPPIVGEGATEVTRFSGEFAFPAARLVARRQVIWWLDFAASPKNSEG